MIKRTHNYLTTRKVESASEAAEHLEREGYVVVRNALDGIELASLRAEIDGVFDSREPDIRSPYRTSQDDTMFRYEMLNRSPLSLQCVGHSSILDVIEPLLGDDCHVIANTAWRNPAGHQTKDGFNWHIDAGPHIPLAEGVEWPQAIPHPVFAIGVHVFLEDSGIDDGPTGVIPKSHLSGRFPPWGDVLNDDLEFNGEGCVSLIAEAGDIAFFVSDIWHRRMPTTANDSGRYFLQVHYGRRDIAQRIKPTGEVNHLEPGVLSTLQSTAKDNRLKSLAGLHANSFYDG